MKAKDSMKSIDNYAWTSKHLDGYNVQIKKTRRVAEGCWVVEPIYRRDN